jgi:uncharacterized membrane-anchored protein YhcB (DUF1043 family)
MSFDFFLYLTSAAAVGLVLGFLSGRYTGRCADRIRELEAHVERLEKERERALAELAAAREMLRLKQEELDTYRGRVADHFAGTSELLRDLTHRYRSVYAHLTAGASELCPEGFVGLEEGLVPGALASGEAEAEGGADERPGDASRAQGEEESKESDEKATRNG